MKKLATLGLLFVVVLAACGNRGKAATVNGEAISLDRLDTEYKRVVAPIAQSGQTLDETQMAEIRADILDRLIEVSLLTQAALASGLTVADEEISSELDVIKGQFPSDQEYKEALKQAGLTEKQLDEQLRQELLVRQHMDAKTKELVLVTDREVDDYYRDNPDMFVTPEQVRASHILILAGPEVPEDVRKQARGKIDEIRSLLLRGANFAETAQEQSEGPSGPNGGDLGFFGRGQMVPPFEAAAFALAEGQISDVVETQFGYHVIQVTGRREAGQLTLEDVRENVKQILKEEKSTQAMNKYVKGLRDAAEIEIHVEEEPAA